MAVLFARMLNAPFMVDRLPNAIVRIHILTCLIPIPMRSKAIFDRLFAYTFYGYFFICRHAHARH